MSAATSNLLGYWFHSVKDEHIHWQGRILFQQNDGYYMVQLFEWLMGSPNIQRLVHISKMTDWLFYETREKMIESYECGVARKGGPYR